MEKTEKTKKTFLVFQAAHVIGCYTVYADSPEEAAQIVMDDTEDCNYEIVDETWHESVINPETDVEEVKQ